MITIYDRRLLRLVIARFTIVIVMVITLTITLLQTTRAELLTVTATGDITDTASGETGTVSHEFYVNFIPTHVDDWSLNTTVSGSGTVNTSNDFFLCIPELLLKAIVLKKLTQDDPAYDGPGGPPTIHKLTGGTFSGQFMLNSPLYSFSGNFQRDPSCVLVEYNAIFADELDIPKLDGALSYFGQTEPNGMGSALDRSLLTLSIEGGGTIENVLDVNYSFAPSISLPMSLISNGQDDFVFQDRTFTFTGDAYIRAIPEPTIFALLAAGLVTLRVCAWLRRRGAGQAYSREVVAVKGETN